MKNNYNYNLIDLNDIFTRNKDEIKVFLIYNGAKKIDINDLKSLTSFIEFVDKDNRKGFLVSFVIEKIDKEFDLLKYGNNRIVNIEMKIKKIDEGLEQAKKNFVILSRFIKNVNIYVFIESKNKLYYYDHVKKILFEVDKKTLNEELSKITNAEIPQMEAILSNPYQHSSDFLNDNYDLSQSQKNIKKDILKLDSKIYAIKGSGGTGKTVLALDLYKDLLNKYQDDKVLYLTPFAKKEIISQELNQKYDFQMVRYFTPPKKCKILIVDEAQRLGKKSLDYLLENSECLILFFDDHQDLDNINQINDFLTVNNDIVSSKSLNYVLRNDSTFDRFAKKICGFGTSEVKNKNFDPNKIEIYMYSEKNKYEKYLPEGKLIWCTPCKYGNECELNCKDRKCEQLIKEGNTSIIHFEISKDEKIVILYLCSGFTIKDNKIEKKLNICSGNLQNQIYSIITRTTEKLIIICDEICMYNFCMKNKLDLKK